MRKKSLTLLSLILAGLLLCGIGAGIMLNEISSLEYEGEYVYNSGNNITNEKILSVKEIPQEKIKIELSSNGNPDSITKKLVVDDTIEEGYIKIVSKFDENYIQPSYYVEKMDLDGEILHTGNLIIFFHEYISFFDEFFNLKDVILDDLKNKKLRSYRCDSSVDVVISAAHQTAERIKF